MRTTLVAVAAALLLAACSNGTDAEPTATTATTSPSTTVFTEIPTETPSTTTPDRTAVGVTVATVAQVVDGDTFHLVAGGTVRMAGIDTVERWETCYAEAGAALTALIAGRDVTLVPTGGDDVDRYGRLLRYVEVDGIDVNLEMIRSGWAAARYDSRDGYGRHPREDLYIRADIDSVNQCGRRDPLPTTTTAGAASSGGSGTETGAGTGAERYRTCAEAKAAGAGPFRAGIDADYEPSRDGDGDGIACE